jgi:1-acyl-sn-glycerol-3-phosphate acyltransferase
VIAPAVAAAGRLVGGGSVTWLTEPGAERQRIFFANHSSHLDFVLVWAHLPPAVRRRTRPVAAEDYWAGGAARRYFAARVFDAVLIDRAGGGEQAVARMVAGLGDEHSLIVFPEGTRGSGAAVAPFKSGLYYLARARPDVELVPVSLENLNRILPKGEVVPVPMISRVTFGPGLRLEDSETKADFLARARDAVVRLQSA